MQTNTEPSGLNKADYVVARAKKSWRPGILDVFMIGVMCLLLYYGASWQIFRVQTDAAEYECYAAAFWHGTPALKQFSTDQCGFITHPEIASWSNATIVNSMHQLRFPRRVIRFVALQNPTQPFHALPHEYPLLSLIPFSLGLLAGSHDWYQVAFALWMAGVAAIIYVLLARYRSRRAAIACAIYLVTGGWGTAAGRFDLLPSALTLIAVICAVAKKWNWSFAALALAVLFKLYPFVLLPPLLIAQQLESRERWYSWRRLIPLGVFVAECIVVTSISLLLSVEGTLAPLSYFQNRPFQIESAWASLLWLLRSQRYPLSVSHTYGSLNLLSPLFSQIAPWATILLVVGLLYVYWLQWRSKINLAAACLLTLLIVMLTSKVFSPQYLIWVAPLIAYIGEDHPGWLLPWTILGVLTTWIYPYIYNLNPDILSVPNIPLFYPVVAARNGLLLGFTLALLIYYSFKRRVNIDSSNARSGGPTVVKQI